MPKKRDTLPTLLTELIWLDQRAKNSGVTLFTLRTGEAIRLLSEDIKINAGQIPNPDNPDQCRQST